jgi:hypothetical protein
MAIVQTLHTATQFADAFKQSSRANQFSYEALEAIFEYMEDFSNDTGEPVEFDPVGICCTFAECHYTDIAETYNVDLSECETDEERIETVRDFIENETWSYVLSDGVTIVFVQF